MSAIGSHTRPIRGATNDWLTPPSIIDAFPTFDLDPCASVDQPWPTAATMWTVDVDGLDRDWFGRVWLNPPYGPEAWAWLDRLADHGNGIALVFARTETAGFVSTVWERATALRFIHGRLHFHYPVTGERAKGNSGGPSVLIAYGDKCAELLRTVDIAGTFTRIGESA